MWTPPPIGTFRNKDVTAKNNGHQNFTKSLGMPTPPAPLFRSYSWKKKQFFTAFLRQGASQQGSTGREHFYVEFIFHRNVQDRSLKSRLIVCQRFSYFCSTEIISEKCYGFVIEASISSNWCRTPEYDINCQTSSETAPLDMLHVKSRLFFSLQSKSKHEMCLVFVTNTPLFIQLLTAESIY